MRCRRLLVAHDGTPDGDRLLRALAAQDIDCGDVNVFHVLLPLDGAFGSGPWFAAAQEEALGEAFARIRRSVSDSPWADAAVHVAFGDPAHEIAKLAAETKADLVAVGTHARHGLARIVMGSVASRVLRLAPCPVLVVPNAAAPDQSAS